jgi:mono/diheme cytochrome c family protein
MNDTDHTDPATGGPQQPSGPDPINRTRAWLGGLAIGVIAVIALMIAFTIGANSADESASTPTAPGTTTTTASTTSSTPVATGPGRELFISHCAACHTLSEAGTTGKVGPDLDSLKPSVDLVHQAIVDGGVGSGAMPKNLVSGAQVTQIAEYVAAATGGG